MPTKSLKTRIETVLTDIQPALGMHGGSIELVEITNDKVVKLRFKGACVGCLAADMTLEYGLKELLMMQIEDIEDVVAVNDEVKTHMPPTPFAI